MGGGWSHSSPNNNGLWLWVPACAGTTRVGSAMVGLKDEHSSLMFQATPARVDGQNQKPDCRCAHAYLPRLTSRAAVAGPSIGIIVDQRGPYLAIEAAGTTRTGIASPVARRRHGAKFFRGPCIIQAKVGLLVMMTNAQAARLARGSRDHGGHHYRRTRRQHQKPHRISAHACLPRFRALVQTYLESMRPSLKSNFIRALLLGEPAQHVVPAKRAPGNAERCPERARAGTHNHHSLCCAKPGPGLCLRWKKVVMGPRVRGTTRVGSANGGLKRRVRCAAEPGPMHREP
jgi:hypothetical protein